MDTLALGLALVVGVFLGLVLGAVRYGVCGGS